MSKAVLRKYNVINNGFTRNFNTKPNPPMPACDFTPSAYKGLSYDKMKLIRKRNLNPALTTYYSKPLAFHQGYMQWLFDLEGKRYLDLFGGICTVSVGHSHPKITEAVTKQMSTLGHVSNIYYHPKIHEYAERLADKMPGDLKVVYFVNSGSEANDLATLIARAYTGNFDVVSLMNGYHGMTYQTMGLCNLGIYKYPVAQPNGIHRAMNPDVYKGCWGGSNCRDSLVQTTRKCSCAVGECSAKNNYLKQLNELYLHCLPKGNVAAFFAESIQGVGGTVQYPNGYLKGAYELIKQNGGLFIADEVQTGFGRTGEHFWGFESHGIQPDIVTMAKGIGNGFPLAAVVTTPEISKALTRAAHFNTFGGNPISCTVGLEVLDIIEDEKLQENCKEVGGYLIKKLEHLRESYKIVGDVRGKGLMLGIELVHGDGTTNPLNPKEFMEIWEECRDSGLILGKGGLFGNVLRIKPPMCITKEDADFAYEVLDKSLDSHLNKRLRGEPVFISGDNA